MKEPAAPPVIHVDETQCRWREKRVVKARQWTYSGREPKITRHRRQAGEQSFWPAGAAIAPSGEQPSVATQPGNLRVAAGLTRAASSSTSPRRRRRAASAYWPTKPSSTSASCSLSRGPPLKPVMIPSNAKHEDNPRHRRSSKKSAPGARKSSATCCRNRPPRARQLRDTELGAFTRYLEDGRIQSTTTLPSAHCARSRWDARTGCSPAATAAATRAPSP